MTTSRTTKPTATATSGAKSAAAAGAKAVRGAADQAEAATGTAAEAVTEAAEEVVEEAAAPVADPAIDPYVDLSRAQFEAAAERSAKMLDEVQGLAKGNVDAAFAAAETLVRGMTGLNRALYAYQLDAMRQAVGTFRTLMAARSLNEAMDVQRRYARSAIDGAVAESTRFSGMGVKVANDAIAPIAARVNVTVERMAKPAA